MPASLAAVRIPLPHRAPVTPTLSLPSRYGQPQKAVVQDDAPADDQAVEEAEAAANDAAGDDPPAVTDGGADAQQQDEPPNDDDAPDTVDPALLTVAALRDELQKRGLSTAGKKAELVDRLTEAQV